MTEAVADTHTALWYLFGNPRLSASAKSFIREAADARREIAVSSISLAEVVYLVEKRRVIEAAYEVLAEALANPEHVFVEAPLNAAVVRAMHRVSRAEVSGPAGPGGGGDCGTPECAGDQPGSDDSGGEFEDESGEERQSAFGAAGGASQRFQSFTLSKARRGWAWESLALGVNFALVVADGKGDGGDADGGGPEPDKDVGGVEVWAEGDGGEGGPGGDVAADEVAEMGVPPEHLFLWVCGGSWSSARRLGACRGMPKTTAMMPKFWTQAGLKMPKRARQALETKVKMAANQSMGLG